MSSGGGAKYHHELFSLVLVLAHVHEHFFASVGCETSSVFFLFPVSCFLHLVPVSGVRKPPPVHTRGSVGGHRDIRNVLQLDGPRLRLRAEAKSA